MPLPRHHSRLSLLLATVLLLAPRPLPAEPVSADATPLAGRRVLWLGDSITQAGDYVGFTLYYLSRAFPRETFDVIAIGLSGETASGLSETSHGDPRPCIHDRLPRALELTRPALVLACYGMNDGIYHPPAPERLQAFQTGMQKLVATCRAAGAEVVLLTPPPFSRASGKEHRPLGAASFAYSTPYEDYDAVLGEFAAWQLAQPAAFARVIDLHGPMNAYVAERQKTTPAFTFAKDGVHPEALGHLLMARIVVRGLGLSLPPMEKDLEAELARIQADPLYPLVKRQREARSEAWRAHIGRPGAIEKSERETERLQRQIDQLRAAPAEPAAPPPR